VRLEDAAGNSTTLVPAHVFEVPAPPVIKSPVEDLVEPGREPATPTVPVGTPPATVPLTSGLAQLSLAEPSPRTLSSARPTWISGHLLDKAGNPIPKAVVTVQTRTFLPKPHTAVGQWVLLGSATTNAAGEFRARIPGGPSRTVLVTYKPGAIDPLPAALAQADLVVPANVTVRAERSRVRNGHSMVLRGAVAGPIPRGGVLVALEVRDVGRWIPVATTHRWVKTSNGGRFTLSYRFHSTLQPTTYRFRVVADEDSAFQYSRGVSRTIAVRVRP
jgi:hypothetical protein